MYTSPKRFALVLLIAFAMLLAACDTTAETTEAPLATEEVATEEVVQPTEEVSTPLPEPVDVMTPEPMPALVTVSSDILLDPATASDVDSLMLNGYIYEGLLRLDSSGNPAAALATSWTISDDGLDYIFELRGNVTFHDGSAFNADAVLANFNRWFDPADATHGTGTYAAWQQYFLGFKGEVDANGQPVSSFDGVEKVNDYTVLVHLNRPMPDLLTVLAQPAFAMVSPASLAAGEGFGLTAAGSAGTGPYLVTSWTGESLVLSPNTGYWDVVPTGDLIFGWK